MRGKEYTHATMHLSLRITPAYAGKSRSNNGKNSAEKDHPRLCGEKISRNRLVSSGRGSPPPMRGKVTF